MTFHAPLYDKVSGSSEIGVWFNSFFERSEVMVTFGLCLGHMLFYMCPFNAIDEFLSRLPLRYDRIHAHLVSPVQW